MNDALQEDWVILEQLNEKLQLQGILFKNNSWGLQNSICWPYEVQIMVLTESLSLIPIVPGPFELELWFLYFQLLSFNYS